MPPLPSTVRTTIAAVGVFASALLLFTTPVTASTVHAQRARAHRRACDGRTEVRHALARAIRHSPPPLLHTPATQLKQGDGPWRVNLDDSAIQNDGPAIEVDLGWQPSSIEPAWLLPSRADIVPLDQRAAQPSPRGPPLYG